MLWASGTIRSGGLTDLWSMRTKRRCKMFKLTVNIPLQALNQLMAQF